MPGAFLFSPLNIGLNGYWHLEEASGSRADSSQLGLTLTDNNSTLNAAGKILNAANFVRASNQYLTRPNETNLVFSGDQTIVAWVNLTSKQSNEVFIGKGSGALLGATSEYVLKYTSGADRFNFSARFGTSPQAVANTFGSPTLGVWYFLCAIVDSANVTVKISVNNGAFDTAVSTSTRVTGSLQVMLGSGMNSTGTEVTTSAVDGLIDAVGMWRRQLTAYEISRLYAGGLGRQIPNL